MSNNWKHKFSLPALLVLSTLLVGCGASSAPVDDGGDAGGTKANSGSGSGTGTGTGTGSGTAFLPAYSESFNRMTGVGGANPTYTTQAVQTDSILKVKITAGPAGNLSLPGSTYSNFTANYSCISFAVTVLGKTVTTQTLAVNGGGPLCPGAPESQVIDFSSRLTANHPPVTVSVSGARYDFYCGLWYNGFVLGTYNMYCPLRTVYQNHTVSGMLDIQTNGTSL